MFDANAKAAHARAIAKLGLPVTFQRLSGADAATVSFAASVTAIIRNYVADTGSPERSGYGENQLGGITQGDRQVIVLAADLKQRRFPLPLRKNDKIIIDATGELITIVSVDAEKRIMAGVIEVMAASTA